MLLKILYIFIAVVIFGLILYDLIKETRKKFNHLKMSPNEPVLTTFNCFTTSEDKLIFDAMAYATIILLLSILWPLTFLPILLLLFGIAH